MSYEAELAKDVSYKFECKKDALRQNQDGSWKFTVNIHPQEYNNSLSGDAMGQRYIAVLVPLNDDETPREKGVPAKNYTTAAKLLANDSIFRKFVLKNYPEGSVLIDTTFELYIENYCGVKSCSEIKDGTEAGKKFARLYAEFKDWERL